MNRNVDLTQNQDFSRTTHETFLGVLIELRDSIELAKTTQTLDSQLTFPVGNANERTDKKHAFEFATPYGGCDCCGTTNPIKLLGKSLCIECEQNVLYGIHRPFWRRTNR